nr:hypothetical protein BgiMline_011571 [Biomphalaria glabrata]
MSSVTESIRHEDNAQKCFSNRRSTERCWYADFWSQCLQRDEIGLAILFLAYWFKDSATPCFLNHHVPFVSMSHKNVRINRRTDSFRSAHFGMLITLSRQCVDWRNCLRTWPGEWDSNT